MLLLIFYAAPRRRYGYRHHTYAMMLFRRHDMLPMPKRYGFRCFIIRHLFHTPLQLRAGLRRYAACLPLLFALIDDCHYLPCHCHTPLRHAATLITRCARLYAAIVTSYAI